MDIVGACLLDGFPTDNKLSLKTSKSAAKGELVLVYDAFACCLYL